jgi:hypothetical protein
VNYPHPALPPVIKSLQELERDRALVVDLSKVIYHGQPQHPAVPVTMSQVFELLAKHGYHRLPMPSALMFGSVAAALATWRLTKGAYLFDKDIWEQIRETPLTKLPQALLQRLPEPAPLLLFPTPLDWSGYQVDATHVYLEWDNREDPHLELRFLCWIRHEPEHKVLSVALDLDAETLDDCLERTIQRTWKELAGAPRSDELIGTLEESQASVRHLLLALLNATLFLCQEEPDLSDTPRQRPPARAKLKLLQTPRTLRVIQTGWRWGAALRQYQAQQAVRAGTEGPPTGRSVQPHVRRAHWHLFWTGEGSRKDPSKAVPRIKWVGATLVGGEIEAVTVRELKEGR